MLGWGSESQLSQVPLQQQRRASPHAAHATHGPSATQFMVWGLGFHKLSWARSRSAAALRRPACHTHMAWGSGARLLYLAYQAEQDA